MGKAITHAKGPKMNQNRAKTKAIAHAKCPKMSQNSSKPKAIAHFSYFTLFTGLRNEM